LMRSMPCAWRSRETIKTCFTNELDLPPQSTVKSTVKLPMITQVTTSRQLFQSGLGSFSTISICAHSFRISGTNQRGDIQFIIHTTTSNTSTIFKCNLIAPRIQLSDQIDSCPPALVF
jgi:hypothetical protein